MTMIIDLFEDCICRCGNSTGFNRLEILEAGYGLDYICQCNACLNIFIRTYSRDTDYEERKK